MSKPLPLLRHFRKLKDPRLDRRKLHSLEAILVIAICAVIAGANDFQQVALFGHKRKDWLKRFLALPNGIPNGQSRFHVRYFIGSKRAKAGY